MIPLASRHNQASIQNKVELLRRIGEDLLDLLQQANNWDLDRVKIATFGEYISGAHSDAIVEAAVGRVRE